LSLRGVDLGRHQVAGSHTVHIAPRLRQPKKAPELKQPPKPEVPRAWFVTAARPLKRGDILRKSDVTLQQQAPKQRITDAVAREINGVIDMELTQPLKQGQPLKVNMLRHPILVHRNELITVISRAPGVQAQLTAKATQQGSMGELVIVQSLSTREKYPARVSGHKQAEVFAGGIVVPNRPRPPRNREIERISLRDKP
jgi:flagella basal body P-ring formation protein FlgA